MRSGGGHAKGSAFERAVCKRLSLWLSKGERDDLFWRSALSGGRATLSLRKDLARILINKAQAGDISAISEGGWKLIERYFIEAKNYADLNIPQAVLKGTGNLYAFWKRTVNEAVKYRRFPILIAKQNRYPTLAVVSQSDPLFGNHVPLMESRRLDAKIFDFEVVTAQRSPSILNDEVWREIPGYVDYFVSSLGRIRLLDEEISPYSDPRYIGIREPGCSIYAVSIAKLVLMAFVGLSPEGKSLACHLDDNPANNSVWNVAWGSHADNGRDRLANGRMSAGLTVKGRVWINDGVNHRMIPVNEAVPEGWFSGRLFARRSKRSAVKPIIPRPVLLPREQRGQQNEEPRISPSA